MQVFVWWFWDLVFFLNHIHYFLKDCALEKMYQIYVMMVRDFMFVYRDG